MSKLRTIIGIVFFLLASVTGTFGATFGNASGTTNTNSFENLINAQVFTLAENGLATSMTAYLNVTSAAKKVKLAIWRASDSALVAYTDEQTVAAGTAAEVTFTFTPDVRLFAGDYRLGVWGASGAGFGQIGDDASSASTVLNQSVTYSSATISPMVSTATPGSSPLLHIFCTYTPGTPNIFGDSIINISTLTVEGTIESGVYTSPASAVRLDSMAVWIDFSVHSTTSSTRGSKMAVYKASDSSLVDTTYHRDIEVANNLDGRYVYVFPSAPTLLASTSYQFAMWSDTSYGTITVRVNTASGSGIRTQTLHYLDNAGVYPNPLAQSRLANYKMSVEMYYSSAGSGRRPRDNASIPWNELPCIRAWPHMIGRFAWRDDEVIL